MLKANKKNKVSLLKALNLKKPRKNISANKRKDLLLKSGIILIIIIIIFFIFSISVTVNRYSGAAESVKESTGLNILSEIRKTITLPEEVPTMYKIDNPEELALKSNFFDVAKIGDVLIYYKNIKKAIIWREESKSIIRTGEFELNQAIE